MSHGYDMSVSIYTLYHFTSIHIDIIFIHM